ncbi:MAG TPA: hypothetical protein VMW23_02305 [Sedimentisphaerales bacterium]|nr:hypothetical protein [Sedimentisphaerales bacterium]
MKPIKGDKGLLDKNRFKKSQQEKKLRLKNLSASKALQLEESLISSELIREWRHNFPQDNPVCLKIGLSKKNENSAGTCV